MQPDYGIDDRRMQVVMQESRALWSKGRISGRGGGGERGVVNHVYQNDSPFTIRRNSSKLTYLELNTQVRDWEFSEIVSMLTGRPVN